VIISHNMNDVFAVSDRIAALYLGNMVAQVKAADVTHAQIVELITAGRSGNLGLPRVVVEAIGATENGVEA
jgi:D-xylose transport system ATP-binding protein